MKKEPRPAATLVLVRNSAVGLQTLLLRRHTQMRVGGKHWVFPGGGIDNGDGPLGEAEQQSAMRAAVRETREEAGLEIAPRNLQLLSHWTTPEGYAARFATWFFLAEGDQRPVLVDGEEMDAYLWDTPAALLEAHRSGEFPMMPPTVVTLTELQCCPDVAAAKGFYASREVPFIQPRKAVDASVTCMLYRRDAGYATQDHTLPGARDRSWLENGIWRYEFSEG